MNGYSIERCWKVNGFLPRYKPNAWKRLTTGGTFTFKHANVAQGEKELNENPCNGEERSNVDLAATQYQKLMELMKQENNGKSGGHESHNGTALLVGTCFLTENKFKGWIIDNSATDHMCSDLSLFSHYEVVDDTNHYVTIPDERKVLIKLIGRIKLSSKIELEKVFYVP